MIFTGFAIVASLFSFGVIHYISQILTAAAAFERVGEADNLMQSLEAAYMRTAGFAADSYLVSSQEIEKMLLQVYETLQEKRRLLEDCKAQPADCMLRSSVRNRVLRRLSRAFLSVEGRTWQETVRSQLHCVDAILTQRKMESGARTVRQYANTRMLRLHSGANPFQARLTEIASC